MDVWNVCANCGNPAFDSVGPGSRLRSEIWKCCRRTIACASSGNCRNLQRSDNLRALVQRSPNVQGDLSSPFGARVG